MERESPQKVPQVSVELLGGQVTNVKFQASLQVLYQANREVMVPFNSNVGMT